MQDAIDFYFDFTSPFAYLAAPRVEAIAARHRRALNWHPVLLAALAQETGVKLTPFVPSKWAYAQKDLARMAERLQMPFRLPPAFPQLWLLPPRAMLWIRAQHGVQVATAFARACYHTAFGEGIDINDIGVLGELARRLGMDARALEAGVASAAVKEALQHGNAAALARGVFGTPFVIADGEPFWGGDRLDLLDEWLARTQPRAA